MITEDWAGWGDPAQRREKIRLAQAQRATQYQQQAYWQQLLSAPQGTNTTLQGIGAATNPFWQNQSGSSSVTIPYLSAPIIATCPATHQQYKSVGYTTCPTCKVQL